MWYPIIDASVSESGFIVDGLFAEIFPVNAKIRVKGKNAGNYFITGVEEGGGDTILTVSPAPSEDEGGGSLRKKKRHPDL